MARDATARLYDVDEDSVVFTRLHKSKGYDQGTLKFRARKGKLVDSDTPSAFIMRHAERKVRLERDVVRTAIWLRTESPTQGFHVDSALSSPEFTALVEVLPREVIVAASSINSPKLTRTLARMKKGRNCSCCLVKPEKVSCILAFDVVEPRPFQAMKSTRLSNLADHFSDRKFRLGELHALVKTSSSCVSRTMRKPRLHRRQELKATGTPCRFCTDLLLRCVSSVELKPCCYYLRNRGFRHL